MARFHCGGSINIFVPHDVTEALHVYVHHDIHHMRYTDIGLPQRWKDYIKENIGTSAGDVRQILLYISFHPSPSLRE